MWERALRFSDLGNVCPSALMFFCGALVFSEMFVRARLCFSGGRFFFRPRKWFVRAHLCFLEGACFFSDIANVFLARLFVSVVRSHFLKLGIAARFHFGGTCLLFNELMFFWKQILFLQSVLK